jgi:hypothetical protein
MRSPSIIVFRSGHLQCRIQTTLTKQERLPWIYSISSIVNQRIWRSSGHWFQCECRSDYRCSLMQIRDFLLRGKNIKKWSRIENMNANPPNGTGTTLSYHWIQFWFIQYPHPQLQYPILLMVHGLLSPTIEFNFGLYNILIHSCLP